LVTVTFGEIDTDVYEVPHTIWILHYFL